MHSTTASLLLTKLNTGNRFFMRAELKDCDEESTLDARDEIKNLLAAGFIRKAGERRYEILIICVPFVNTFSRRFFRSMMRGGRIGRAGSIHTTSSVPYGALKAKKLRLMIRAEQRIQRKKRAALGKAG